jgi:MFS family permease
MGQLDASIATLTFNPVSRQFGAGLAAVQWISLAYLLTLVPLLVPVGRVSDVTGRKVSYIRGLIVFAGGSALCGLAPDLRVLILGRVVQGVGAALLQSNSVALVAGAAPPGRMRQALGAQAAAQGLGLALGPTAGGLIVATLGWRWVYAINVPIGLAVAVLAVVLLPRTSVRLPTASVDVTGSVLLALATGTVLLGLSALSGLRLPVWFFVLMAGATATAAWLRSRRTKRQTAPAGHAPVLGGLRVRSALLSAACGYLLLFGPLVLVPAVLGARGVSPLRSGLVLGFLPAGFAFAASASNRLLPRLRGDHWRAGVGAASAALIMCASLFVPFSDIPLAALLFGLGAALGVFAPANNASVMRKAGEAQAATAGGALNMSRGVGTALGISVVTLALHSGGSRLALGWLLVASVVCFGATAISGIGTPRP